MIPWLQSQRVAVITGGANGIGLACAQRFLGAGMRVVLADRDADALAAAPDVWAPAQMPSTPSSATCLSSNRWSRCAMRRLRLSAA